MTVRVSPGLDGLIDFRREVRFVMVGLPLRVVFLAVAGLLSTGFLASSSSCIKPPKTTSVRGMEQFPVCVKALQRQSRSV